jgi:hypothetical protein
LSRVARHAGEEAGAFAIQVDIVVDEERVARADAVFLTATDKQRQKDPAQRELTFLFIKATRPGQARTRR